MQNWTWILVGFYQSAVASAVWQMKRSGILGSSEEEIPRRGDHVWGWLSISFSPKLCPKSTVLWLAVYSPLKTASEKDHTIEKSPTSVVKWREARDKRPQSGAEELIYEEGLKMKGGLPAWLSFPYPLLVTQRTLWIVGEVIVKELWQGVISHPLCGCIQPCSILHGGVGGQQKCPLDSERSWAMDAGWPGGHCEHLGPCVFWGFKHLICIVLEWSA